MMTNYARAVIIAVAALVASMVLTAFYDSPITRGIAAAATMGVVAAAGGHSGLDFWWRVLLLFFGTALLAWLSPPAPVNSLEPASLVWIGVVVMMAWFIDKVIRHRAKQKHS